MVAIEVHLSDGLARAVSEAGLPIDDICRQALVQAVADRSSDPEPAPPTTSRTSTAVRLAGERARAEGAVAVTSRHLLARLLAEGATLALTVVRALGIDPDDLAGRLTAGDPGPAGPTNPLEPVASACDAGLPPLDDAAAAAVERAVAESISRGSGYVGTEHLLLGLTTGPESEAGLYCATWGADPASIRLAVVAAVAGFLHLRAEIEAGAARGAETTAPGPAREARAVPTADVLTAEVVTAEVRAHLQPLADHVERLERRLPRL